MSTSPRSDDRSSVIPIVVIIVPAVLCLIGVAVLFYCLVGQPLAASSNNIDELVKSRDPLQDRLNLIALQALHDQWLLSALIGVAGLLTLGQGLFAYFSAQNYVQEAEKILKDANENLQAVQSKFPAFAAIDHARSEGFKKLSERMKKIEREQLNGDYENLYLRCNPEERQEIFAIESFSAAELIAPTSIEQDKQFAKYLQLLGKFYGGKFVSEKPPLIADLERAQYYLDTALRKSGRDYTVLNDKGWLLALATPQPEMAVKLYEESLLYQPKQQRALYCLGTLCWKKGDKAKLEEGLALLNKAIMQPFWEKISDPHVPAHIEYNRACFCDGLSSLCTDTTLKESRLDECCEHLEAAAQYGKQSEKLLGNDLKIGGDLENLKQSHTHSSRLNVIMTRYREAWASQKTVDQED